MGISIRPLVSTVLAMIVVSNGRDVWAGAMISEPSAHIMLIAFASKSGMACTSPSTSPSVTGAAVWQTENSWQVTSSPAAEVTDNLNSVVSSKASGTESKTNPPSGPTVWQRLYDPSVARSLTLHPETSSSSSPGTTFPEMLSESNSVWRGMLPSSM